MWSEVVEKVIRKRVIWEQIKAKEREFKRLQEQVLLLQKAQEDLINDVQQLLQDSQEIAEYLDAADMKRVNEKLNNEKNENGN